MRLFGEILRKSGLNCSPRRDVHRDHRVRQPALLQHDRDLEAVRRRPVIKLDRLRRRGGFWRVAMRRPSRVFLLLLEVLAATRHRGLLLHRVASLARCSMDGDSGWRLIVDGIVREDAVPGGRGAGSNEGAFMLNIGRQPPRWRQCCRCRSTATAKDTSAKELAMSAQKKKAESSRTRGDAASVRRSCGSRSGKKPKLPAKVEKRSRAWPKYCERHVTSA